jgi:hypothetical protein
MNENGDFNQHVTPWQQVWLSSLYPRLELGLGTWAITVRLWQSHPLGLGSKTRNS